MNDVFPRRDTEVLASARNFKETVAADPAGFGMTPAQAAEIEAVFDNFEAKMRELAEERAALRAKVTEKREARAELEGLYRQRIRQIQSSPTVTDGQRKLAGIRVRDREPSPVNAPDEPPQFRIYNDYGGQHRIRFWEKGSARARRRAKGVLGCEIWLRIGGDAGEGSGFRLHMMASHTPHSIKFGPEDVGKQAFYYLRWMTRRGEFSPQSAIQSATITG